jgi:intracellular multiplication protein IcmG
MADDKKAPDEYQYPPEEYYKGGEYLPDETVDPIEPEVTRARRSFLPSRVMWFLGFLIAIILVYLILSYINTKRNMDLAQQAPITAAIPSTTTAQTVPVEQTPQQTLAVETPNNTDVQRLTMQNQANQQSIASMQSQIQQMQTQMSDLTNTISALGTQIQVLANEIKAISTDRAVSGRSISTNPGIVYHLKALVPGRAWIQSPDGAATTVTLGDRLPGYGIIQMINTDQGIVTTSSGAIIQYGTKDR